MASAGALGRAGLPAPTRRKPAARRDEVACRRTCLTPRRGGVQTTRGPLRAQSPKSCPGRHARAGHGGAVEPLGSGPGAACGARRSPRTWRVIARLSPQACIDENFDMVRFLVENGADVDRQDNEGWTPLHAAASCGHLNIAE